MKQSKFFLCPAIAAGLALVGCADTNNPTTERSAATRVPAAGINNGAGVNTGFSNVNNGFGPTGAPTTEPAPPSVHGGK